MKFTYCPDCGTKLIQKEIGDEGLVPWCECCNKPFFDMFSTCIIALVADEYAEAKKKKLELSGEVDDAVWVDASRALEMVHPEGSVSYTLVESYLKEQGHKRQKGSSL